MDIKSIFSKAKADFDGAVEFYKQDISSIRTGRATPALVEDILVDYYGQRLHIKELGSISVPEPRVLAIQPWDKGAVEPIYGAIRDSDIGINPVVDGNVIRLVIPALTEERRKEFVKTLKKKTEESRIKIRQVREHIWSEVQKIEKEGLIREDDKFKAKEDLQKMVDDYNGKIGEIEAKKESELLIQ